MIELPAPRLGGHFTFEVGTSFDNRRKVGETDNLIVDEGLDHIFNNPTTSVEGQLSYCSVGTGVVAVAVGNEYGVDFVPEGRNNSSETTARAWDGTNKIWTSTKVFIFNPGTVDGVALSEVCTHLNSTASVMFCRALISPTVTLDADEYLYVTYTLKVYPPKTGTPDTGTFDITDLDPATPVPYTYNYSGLPVAIELASWSARMYGALRRAYLCSNTELIAIEGALLTTTAINEQSARTNATYTPGNFYIDTEFEWYPADGNYYGDETKVVGLESYIYSAPRFYQFKIVDGSNDGIFKGVDKTLKLTFRFSLARYVP